MSFFFLHINKLSGISCNFDFSTEKKNFKEICHLKLKKKNQHKKQTVTKK